MSLVIVRAVGLVTVQDQGRPGHMHEGLPPGGALVPQLLAAANRSAGNSDDTAAIEVMGMVTVRAEADVIVATDSMAARRMRVAEELMVASGARRVTYLAVRGGIDAPVVLGSRSTQPGAGIGHLLRSGVRVDVDAQPTVVRPIDPFDDRGVIRVIPGPDVDAFGPAALEILTSAPYTVLPASNRVGTRLAGAPLPRTDRPEVTRPMVRGAIEVPRDGQPIVLGPEHPTTGGYPVIGVVLTEDLGRLFAIPPGGSVTLAVLQAK